MEDHEPGGLNPAPGAPGIEPRWTRAAKDAVGTAASRASHVWFTVSLGTINEVYYPTIDKPQLRDLQFLITDGETFFHDERRHLTSTIEPLGRHAPGYRIVNTDEDGRYRIVKEIITDAWRPTVLVHTSLEAAPGWDGRLRMFLLAAPHLNDAGWGNYGESDVVSGQTLLLAHKDDAWLAIGATVPFLRTSIGYVGVNDGWTDLADNFEMNASYDFAGPGNIALTAELDISAGSEFTMALSFGDRRHGAVNSVLQSLGRPFAGHRTQFLEEWEAACRDLLPLTKAARDGGKLLMTSEALLLSHEDKLYEGAMIASLSIPWGENRSDAATGGYHLVWTRDMVNSSMGLLAAGNTTQPLRALIYLAATQRPGGGFYQNFWVTGDPHWTGIQLDEVAFPILLAWRLDQLGALRDFDPYPMVMAAAGYIVEHGPVTPQERWEEAAGYSPSTLASNIAALVCAAEMARDHDEHDTSAFILTYADFLECHVEQWTVTTEGTVHPEISRHYIRILPEDPSNPHSSEDPNSGVITLANRSPWDAASFPAKDIVDAGFLELVRYGVRSPLDPLIVDSLAVVDHVLKREFDEGPGWKRYTNDGYGQRTDGSGYEDWGVGRTWPLLTGERGHYELAAGRSPDPYIEAMEAFAVGAGLLTEQVWDGPDLSEALMWHGKPTGAAMPLMWAHAEYVKLLRSSMDGAVFDLVPAVADRYLGDRRECRNIEIWKPNRRPRSIRAGRALRVQAPGVFRVVWTADDWATVNEAVSKATTLGIGYCELTAPSSGAVEFTMQWDDGHWEGSNYRIEVTS